MQPRAESINQPTSYKMRDLDRSLHTDAQLASEAPSTTVTRSILVVQLLQQLHQMAVVRWSTCLPTPVPAYSAYSKHR